MGINNVIVQYFHMLLMRVVLFVCAAGYWSNIGIFSQLDNIYD